MVRENAWHSLWLFLLFWAASVAGDCGIQLTLEMAGATQSTKILFHAFWLSSLSMVMMFLFSQVYVKHLTKILCIITGLVIASNMISLIAFYYENLTVLHLYDLSLYVLDILMFLSFFTYLGGDHVTRFINIWNRRSLRAVERSNTHHKESK